MKILINNVGIDATAAYQAILHHVNMEVDALLGIYEIGAIRRLDFGQEWCVSVNSKGLFFYTLQEAFEKWIRLLYMVVEMQNSIENDFSFLDKVMARGDAPQTITPYKLQFLIEAHYRIFTNFLDGLLNEEFVEIWETALGMTDRTWRINFLSTKFKSIQQSTNYLRASEIRTRMLEMLNSAQYQSLLELGQRCIEQDKVLFEGIKAALRLGLQAFETWERRTKEQGIPAIREGLLKLPELVKTYYANLAEALDRVDPFTQSAPLSAESKVVPAPEGYPGHGSNIQYVSVIPNED
jgi:sulfite reductase (NADPH) flavoprotein alpha-component